MKQDQAEGSIFRHTLRYKNIVYVPTYKCASTYIRNLLLSLGFELISINDVRKDDKMFTTIMDPYIRRTKGITQTVIDFDWGKKLTDKEFLVGIKNATVLDKHTVPYTLQHKKYMNRMIFLPVDMKYITLTELIEKFFEIHCPELNEIKENSPDIIWASRNIANDLQRRHYRFIEENATNKELIEIVFANDAELWHACKKEIEDNLDRYLTAKYQ